MCVRVLSVRVRPYFVKTVRLRPCFVCPCFTTQKCNIFLFFAFNLFSIITFEHATGKFIGSERGKKSDLSVQNKEKYGKEKMKEKK